LVGAVAGVALAIGWSHTTTRVVGASWRRLALDAVLRPALTIVPAQVVLVLVVPSPLTRGLATSIPIGALMLLCTAGLAWFTCLPVEIRTLVRARIRGRSRAVLAEAVRS